MNKSINRTDETDDDDDCSDYRLKNNTNYIRVLSSHAHSEWCEDEGPTHSWNVMTNYIIMMKMTNIIIISIYIMKMLELILPVSLITLNYGRSKN